MQYDKPCIKWKLTAVKISHLVQHQYNNNNNIIIIIIIIM
jgi:hypothetical protein